MSNTGPILTKISFIYSNTLLRLLCLLDADADADADVDADADADNHVSNHHS